MKSAIDYRLYLVTDSRLCEPRLLPDAVAQAIEGGVTVVQLREKDASTLGFYNTAMAVKKVTDTYHIPLIINDRLDIVLAVDAAGLHIGQSDLPAAVARRLLGKDKLLGVSAGSAGQAAAAFRDGADYIGVASCFPTGTKSDAQAIGFEEIRKICASVALPKVGIGGIKADNVAQLESLGLDGIAVVSAIMGQSDPKKCAADLAERLREIGL